VPVIPIVSIDDPRLADYRNIPDSKLLASRGVFIAEGRLVVRRLPDRSRFTTRSLLVTPTAHAALADIEPRLRALPVYVVEQEVLNGVAGFNVHRGCLAVGERGVAANWRDTIGATRLTLVIERVGDADNVGAIFRNAAAFDAGAVLIGPGCADPLYRKAIRTSMGATLQVPFAALADWPADLNGLQAAGFTLAALTPDPGAEAIGRWARALTPHGRVALLVGHEGAGLSDSALDAADARVRIPMRGGTDSLNVATATAIALYELGAH
jgi:tRNA G18 (ribose-2'-O)-methylase SpoU